jgi:hypothetical protein
MYISRAVRVISAPLLQTLVCEKHDGPTVVLANRSDQRRSAQEASRSVTEQRCVCRNEGGYCCSHIVHSCNEAAITSAISGT